MPEFFLGANSGNGFYSLYDNFCTADGDFLHLIKGGPGCGKSSFMRRIGKAAEEKGFEVEYILCSGDPDSLDGIYIPKLKCGYVDATSPHVIEPRNFGADSDYVNLGQFCSPPPCNRIKYLTEKYKSCYKKAYLLLNTAAEIKSVEYPVCIDNAVFSRIESRAKSAVKRNLGSACGTGSVKKRFVSCISCCGELVLTESVDELCKLTYRLDNRLGLARYYFQTVIDEAIRRNDDIIICPSPLLPDIPEAVIFPRQQIGFISGDIYCGEKSQRHVRLDAMVPPEILNEHKHKSRNGIKIYDCIMMEAYTCLAEAKSWHDELEKVYKPYIDFSSLDEFTENEIKKLLKN